MITIQMIRWFVIWLLVFSVGLLLGSLALASTAARTAFARGDFRDRSCDSGGLDRGPCGATGVRVGEVCREPRRGGRGEEAGRIPRKSGSIPAR